MHVTFVPCSGSRLYRVQEKHDNVTFEVVTSMIEIYSEKIRDLLGKGRAGHLKVGS